MIIALWYRWTSERKLRWLLLAVAVVVADLLIGTRLVAWEIEVMRQWL